MAGFSFVERSANKAPASCNLCAMVNRPTAVSALANGSAYWEQALPDATHVSP